MTLSRTLLLPTGMAMTFACHPAEAADPVAQDRAAQDFDPLSEERDAPARQAPVVPMPRDPRA
jgi:hypothetical protein